MIHSQVDTKIWDEEVELLRDQDHLEKVWSMMLPRVNEYVDGYLEGVSHYLDKPTPAESYSAFLNELIKKNDKLHDKYHEIFDIQLENMDAQLRDMIRKLQKSHQTFSDVEDEEKRRILTNFSFICIIL